MKTKSILIGAILVTAGFIDHAQAARRYARPAGTSFRPGAAQPGEPIGPLLVIKNEPLQTSFGAVPLIIESYPREAPITSIQFIAEPPEVITLTLPPPTFNPPIFP